MSQSLGEHEVERVRYNRSVGTRNTSTSHSTEKARERVIMPAEIAQLPNLTAYLAFAGGYPIVKAPVNIINFANVNPTFEE
jgi:type IV secretory pathway TraG/TraD family ATPase VirD4